VPTATTGTAYTGAISISKTTTLRAAAFKAGWRATDVVAQTYIFPNDVIQQAISPTGFPTVWGGTTADYQMDPDVVNNPAYSALIKDALKSIPSISLALNQADMFGSSGIYSNPGGTGVGWERATSIEWINPDG
jgi:hypothetical protein